MVRTLVGRMVRTLVGRMVRTLVGRMGMMVGRMVKEQELSTVLQSILQS
jgi:hypothetical protein